MFQTDEVILQSSTDVNTYGSVSQTWVNGLTITCDVQDINKEYAYKNYGLTESTEYKQIFDLTNADWVKGNQVEYQSEQWIIRVVNKQMSKINLSNHTYVVISKVV